MNFPQNLPQTVAVIPSGIMGLELADIADPPDVVADPVVFQVGPVQFFPADFLTKINRFQHGAVGMSAASNVVNFTTAWILKELVERFNKVVTVNVIADLLPSVTKDTIRITSHGAFHKVGQKAVQFRPGMGGSGQATSPKTDGLHPEITSILLHKDVSRHFTGPEERVFGLIDGHAFINTMKPIQVIRTQLPTFFLLLKGQTIRRVSVNLVRAGKNKRRLRAGQAGRFQKIQGADGVDPEVGVGFLGGPIMTGLGGGMNHQGDVFAVLMEEFFHRLAVPDIQGPVRVTFQGFLQSLPG